MLLGSRGKQRGMMKWTDVRTPPLLSHPTSNQNPPQAFAAGADIKEMASKSFVEAFSTNMFHQVRCRLSVSMSESSGLVGQAVAV
jgi:hypothetical protein